MPIMSVDSIDRFSGVSFDMLNSVEFALAIWLVSFQVRDDLMGSTKVYLYEVLLKDCFRVKIWDDK